MAWEKVTIHFNETMILGHSRGTMFTVPCAVKFAEGDVITANKKQYQVTSVTDVADRGEVFEIETKEVKDDKPKARRSEADSE
jgi:hypothetical protein|tara:strand:+ start:119 stop:367 length:249 start_codon:yes stop_codon:yes gene_type:complete